MAKKKKRLPPKQRLYVELNDEHAALVRKAASLAGEPTATWAREQLVIRAALALSKSSKPK